MPAIGPWTAPEAQRSTATAVRDSEQVRAEIMLAVGSLDPARAACSELDETARQLDCEALHAVARGPRPTCADIMRAQILSQAYVQAIKFTAQRERPDGSNAVVPVTSPATWQERTGARSTPSSR